MVQTSVLPAHARVWQYISDRRLTPDECTTIEREAKAFCQTWTAHHNALTADAFVLHQQILVLAVDEERAGASGCSIDKSTHFVEQLGAKLGVDFFVRDLVFAQTHENCTVQAFKLADLPEAIKSGELSVETPVHNTLAQRLDALQAEWQPIGQTWVKRFV